MYSYIKNNMNIEYELVNGIIISSLIMMIIYQQKQINDLYMRMECVDKKINNIESKTKIIEEKINYYEGIKAIILYYDKIIVCIVLYLILK